MKEGKEMSELSIYELEAEYGEVLPQRETLGVYTFNTHVIAFNGAIALQGYTHGSHNTADATQAFVFVG
jgi:hypothetical protein